MSSDGAYVRTVAGNGEGPGEVQYITGMAFSEDGRLAVLDFSNQRVSIFGPDRQLLHEIRRPAGRPGYGRSAIQWEGDDLWVEITSLRQGTGAPPICRWPTGRAARMADCCSGAPLDTSSTSSAPMGPFSE